MSDILVIDDDRALRRTLELHLTSLEHKVDTAPTAAEGLAIWRSTKPDLVILDLVLPDEDGIQLLTRTRDEQLPGFVILITGHQDLDKAISAMRAGAFDYIHKPINLDELELSVERALSLQEERKHLALVANLADEQQSYKIVGASIHIIELHKKIGLASRGRANVIIYGDSGTGKELVARSIHRHSSPDAPFVAINCSAIPQNLLESELFGHEKGAFTGAIDRKVGRLELAGKGTLFLDEIGDMDIDLQIKLLRVIQEREFERVGSNKSIAFSGRIIAATHRNLEEMIQNNSFREDLYYRLKVVEIHLAPLRERKEDIPLLLEYFLARINRELGRNVIHVPRSLMQQLMEYDWCGNVRELENRVVAGVLISSSDTLQMELPVVNREHTPTPDQWKRSLSEVEREHIALVLKEVEGHLGKACEILGVSRPTLRKKISEYGLDID